MFQKVERRAIRPEHEVLVEESYLSPDEPLPLVLKPKVEGLELSAWAGENLDYLERKLLEHGGILFRDFRVDEVEKFEAFALTITPNLLNYTERTAPRVKLSKYIFTSTEHRKDQYIHFHNANSYSHRWPLKIWFCCITPPGKDGFTPIADCRKVLGNLDPALRREFASRGVTYLRNFREGMGLPWQETFQTTDTEVVREYCADAGIEIDLFEGDRLRTRQVRHAVARHPVTGEEVWFNQAHLFHVSSLEPDVSRTLLRAYAEEDLPRNSYYGDGEPIPETVVSELIEAYRQAEVRFPWQRGDVLMLDNMLAAHARSSYEGDRLIAVTFADIHQPTRQDFQQPS